MADKLKGFLRPYKYKIGRLASGLLRGSMRFTGVLLRVAQKNGFDRGGVWPDEFRAPFQTYSPEPFSIDDLFLLSGAREAPAINTDDTDEIVCSIVIPVFNKAEYTFQCFRSLFAEIDLARHEIIVVNNASTDETSRLLSFFADKIRTIDNAENEGFVDACNKGAAIARGRYLVFLNNDTLVQPKWLDHLVETIEGDDEVGAVGSLLIYPTGRIQEAGGIVWQNGNAYHYGHSGHPDSFRFSYKRETDYCSGASLLVRKQLFDDLGGFDRRYAPAYYEDTDLCMGVRSLGYKVIYQPLSRVVHYEGVTAGKDITSGLKRFQPINRVKFLEKWKDTLAAAHYPESIENVEAAADRKTGPRILVCDETIPVTTRDAGSARMFEILKTLAKIGRVTFSPLNILDEPRHLERLRQMGVRVVYNADLIPVVKGEKFDVAILSRPNVADELITTIRRRCPSAKVIYDTVDLYFVRFAREYALTKNAATLERSNKFKRLEVGLAAKCDQVWCVTDADRDTLLAAAPATSIRLVPNIHSVHEVGKPFSQREGLLFLGSFGHGPNVDAMVYFRDEILAKLKPLLPGIVLNVIGSHPTDEIRSMASDDIRVHGFVEDLDPLMTSCRVFICPLRYGAGLKGKIGHALSYGLPVVTTSIGAEGFGLEEGQDVLIADTADTFAAQVARLYQDEALWARLSANGRAFIESHYSPRVIEAELVAVLDELGVINERRLT